MTKTIAYALSFALFFGSFYGWRTREEANLSFVPYIAAKIPPLSPSFLQMAMFANMAYFPFDFNAGESPRGAGFDATHYRPFYDYIITANSFGFCFDEEMAQWQILYLHNAPSAGGFRAVLYSCEYGATIVLAIKGSDGDISNAFFEQTGSWWYNLQSLAGYNHAHIYALREFLAAPHIAEKFQNANIYITGHSLGGYLAYIATLELSLMGLGDNIRKITAFSAPMFNIDTLSRLRALPPELRDRITHFYVEGDLIAGITGPPSMPPMPSGASAVGLINTLFGNLLGITPGVDPPLIPASISTPLSIAEFMMPNLIPGHFTYMLWWLQNSFSPEALALGYELRGLIRHVQVAQTWQSNMLTAPPTLPPLANIPLLGGQMAQIQDNLIEILFNAMTEVFDTDTHFMMNFYEFDWNF